MAKEALLVRHGETKLSKQGRLQGSQDTHLSLDGIDQVEDLARGLKEQGVVFDGIITSPLNQAQQTARMLGMVFDSPVTIHTGLSERNLGSFEGQLVAELRELHGEEWKHITPPEGESLMDFNARTLSAFSEAVSQYQGERPLLVGHDFSIDSITTYFKSIQSYGVGGSTLYSLPLPATLPTKFGIPTSK